MHDGCHLNKQRAQQWQWSPANGHGAMDFFKKLASNLLDDQENFTDLTQVAVVDAESCISVLSKRFETDVVYTHCGPLLVAVNPYKRMPDLYSEERLDEYAQLLPTEGPPAPHAYEMAARAYGKMMAQARMRAETLPMHCCRHLRASGPEPPTR